MYALRVGFPAVPLGPALAGSIPALPLGRKTGYWRRIPLCMDRKLPVDASGSESLRVDAVPWNEVRIEAVTGLPSSTLCSCSPVASMDGALASAGPNGSHAFAINTVGQPSRTVIGPLGRRYPSPNRRLDPGPTPPKLSLLAKR
jgi:hypothetical protein